MALSGRAAIVGRTPTLVLFSALLLASCATFGFHLIAGRLLPVEQYGLVSALVSLISVVAIPASAIEVTIVRHVGSLPDVGRAAIRRWVVRAGGIGAVGGALVLLGAAPLRRLLDIDDPAILVLLAAYLPIMLTGLVLRGVCLGRLRYHRAAAVVATAAVVRLVGTGGGALLLGATGAVLAIVAAEAVIAVGFLLATRGDVSWRGDVPPIGLPAAALSLFGLGGLWALVGIDVVAARILLPAAVAGSYAAMSVMAKVAFFAPQLVVAVAYPRFVAERGDQRRLVVQVVVAAGALGAGAALLLAASPARLLAGVFGGRFASESALLGPLVAVAVGLAVVSVFVHYHLAHGRRRAMASWPGVAAAVLAMLVGPSSTGGIVAGVGLGTLVTMLALAVGVRRDVRSAASDDRACGRAILTDEPALDLTVVIPYYNPGRAVRDTVSTVIAELRASDVSFEIIAVSDGCTDGSARLLHELRDPALSCIALAHNEGKGAALRVGLERGRGRYLGFIDADGDIDPQLWHPFLSLMRLYEPDVVLGSKRHPLSEVAYPPVRRFLSWGYQQLTRVLFRLDIRDTQTGIKLVRREVLAAVLPRLVERRFTFDVELLAVARRLGYTRLFEAPIRLRHQRFNSTVGWRAVRRMAIDTVLVFVRLRILRLYDVPVSAAAPPATVALPARVEVAA